MSNNKSFKKDLKKEIEPALKRAFKDALLNLSKEDRRIVMQAFSRKGIISNDR